MALYGIRKNIYLILVNKKFLNYYWVFCNDYSARSILITF